MDIRHKLRNASPCDAWLVMEKDTIILRVDEAEKRKISKHFTEKKLMDKSG